MQLPPLHHGRLADSAAPIAPWASRRLGCPHCTMGVCPRCAMDLSQGLESQTRLSPLRHGPLPRLHHGPVAKPPVSIAHPGTPPPCAMELRSQRRPQMERLCENPIWARKTAIFDHQNTLPKNKNDFYGILERRIFPARSFHTVSPFGNALGSATPLRTEGVSEGPHKPPHIRRPNRGPPPARFRQ
jgi:hypothetical protein